MPVSFSTVLAHLSHIFRDVVTRNNAARRLQEAYRVRRANREQHEQENTIFTPAVKHVYSGHRNTRTMVNLGGGGG